MWPQDRWKGFIIMYLDYKTNKAGVYVIDIEGDSLKPTVIWMIGWRNLLTGETGELYDYNEMREFFDSRVDACWIGHNILKFDAHVINRLVRPEKPLGPDNCIDTLVLSTLYSPSINGGHSLAAWGNRLKEPKGGHDDWSKLSPEMIDYCRQDVTVTAKLFVRLIDTLSKIGFTEGSIWLQHHITAVVDQQRRNGFKFNEQAAVHLLSQLRQKEEQLAEEVREVFPAERVLVARRKLYKKDGSFTSQYIKDKGRYSTKLDEPEGIYYAYEDVKFNLGSPKQRVDKLLSLGWKPRTFTKTGNPRPFERGDLAPCLSELLEKNPLPQVQLIANWMAINGRANMVNTWLEAYNSNTGCIHGKLFTADTLRFRHQAPNTANVPAVRHSKSGDILRGEEGFYTYESRDLWIARPGRVLVGTDASGLELRILAHFLNRPEFTKQVVEGDPHQYNADLAGISRPAAKTLIYATLYGAGDAKISATLGLPLKEGAEIKRVFLERLGADRLIEECKREQKAGRIPLCDGSWVVCPSAHSALNYKLQGSGARVMALGSVLLEKAIRANHIDSLKVGDIHDEIQYDVHPDCAEHHARLAVQSIRKAGEYLRLNVPMDATSKIGKTWAETH